MWLQLLEIYQIKKSKWFKVCIRFQYSKWCLFLIQFIWAHMVVILPRVTLYQNPNCHLLVFFEPSPQDSWLAYQSNFWATLYLSWFAGWDASESSSRRCPNLFYSGTAHLPWATSWKEYRMPSSCAWYQYWRRGRRRNCMSGRTHCSGLTCAQTCWFLARPSHCCTIR